jgi:hypothetical protein
MASKTRTALALHHGIVLELQGALKIRGQARLQHAHAGMIAPLRLETPPSH